MKPEKEIKLAEEETLDLEGDLKDTIMMLCRLLSNGFSRIDYEYDYTDTKKWVAYKYREETDEEYEKRIKKEEKEKQEKLESEKRLYEQLKKKFEKEMKDVEE